MPLLVARAGRTSPAAASTRSTRRRRATTNVCRADCARDGERQVRAARPLVSYMPLSRRVRQNGPARMFCGINGEVMGMQRVAQATRTALKYCSSRLRRRHSLRRRLAQDAGPKTQFGAARPLSSADLRDTSKRERVSPAPPRSQRHAAGVGGATLAVHVRSCKVLHSSIVHGLVRRASVNKSSRSACPISWHARQ